MRRTLVRIAHEIIEKNPPDEAGDGSGFAIVGSTDAAPCSPSGAHADERPHGRRIPFGTVDISSTATTSAAVTAARAWDLSSTRPSSSFDRQPHDRDRRRCLYTGRTARSAIESVRLRSPGAGAIGVLWTAATASCRSPGLRRQEPADGARSARERPVSRRSTEATRSRSRRRRAPEEGRMSCHLITIDDLDRAGIERILARAQSFAEVSGREIKKVPRSRAAPS